MTSMRAKVGLGLFPEQGDAPPEHLVRRRSSTWQAVWLVVFWATFAMTLVAIAWLSLIPRQYSFDTGGARQIWKVGAHAYEAQFPGALPTGCVVGCAGIELAKVASDDEVLRAAGRYWIDEERGLVRWSPQTETSNTHESIPVAVLVVPGQYPTGLGKKLWFFWIPAVILAAAGLALATGRRATGADSEDRPPEPLLRRDADLFTLTASGSTTARIILILAVELGLSFSLLPDWNHLVTCPDSRSYVENWRIRTPLTARWIALFDSDRTQPRSGSVPSELRTIPLLGTSHRYATAVRAWKVLFIVSVSVFAWCLAAIIPWWMVASLILAAAALDGSMGPWSTGMSGYLDVLLSEPLSYSLVLLLLASLCAYFARPGWVRGLALVACLNLLILARPASVAFAVLLAAVWLFHWRREGLAPAFRRAGGLTALLLGGILLHCTFNLVRHGHFRQHAFTGMNLMTTALQVADTNDAKAFDDPKLSRYAQVAIGEAMAQRQTPFGPGAADANCWQFAVPAYRTVYGVSAQEEPFAADDVLTRVARTIVRRHPRELGRLAVSSFWNGFWQSAIHVPLLFAGAAAFWLFWRTGDWRFLFVACLAGLPLVGIVPGCVTNYPIDRYRSLTSFAEIWTLPLLIATIATRWRGRSATRDAKSQQGAVKALGSIAA